MYDVRFLGVRFPKAVMKCASVRAEIVLQNTAPCAGQPPHAARAN